MGRTNRQYQHFMKYDLVASIKSRRNQYPLIKRYAHHQHRKNNKFTDEMSYVPF